MKLPLHFKILAESQTYILGNEFEYSYIIDKKTGSNIFLGDNNGDPTFAIIDKNEQWDLLLVHTSYLWTPSELLNLNKSNSTGEMFQWPFDARQLDDFEVEILDDPWSDNPSIYLLNVKEKSINRIRILKRWKYLMMTN
jgi:hypothetical protein